MHAPSGAHDRRAEAGAAEVCGGLVVGCGGGRAAGGAVPGPGGGSGLAVEHAQLVVDAVCGHGAAEAVVAGGLLLGRGQVAEHAVDGRNLEMAREKRRFRQF